MPEIEAVAGNQRPAALAAGDLEELRDAVIDPVYERVDWIMRIHALDAGSMHAHHGLYRQAMKGTASLPSSEREMIAIVVSSAIDCHY